MGEDRLIRRGRPALEAGGIGGGRRSAPRVARVEGYDSMPAIFSSIAVVSDFGRSIG